MTTLLDVHKEDGRVTFFCPGCKTTHTIPYGEGLGPRWDWNGSATHPTLTPSILVRSGHHSDRHQEGNACWCTYNAAHPDEEDTFECARCHSFVTNGSIQFLDDCSHALAGSTVPLPAYPTRPEQQP